MHPHPTTTPTPIRHPFPRAVWNQLSGLDCRLLDELGYLSRLTARRSARGASYCTPGRHWLAQRLGCSQTTISRRTSHLKALGVLSKLQRRPVAGHWQTCLYALIHPIAWQASRLRHLLTTTANRVSRMTHLAPSKGRKLTSVHDDPTFKELISRWKARGSTA